MKITQVLAFVLVPGLAMSSILTGKINTVDVDVGAKIQVCMNGLCRDIKSGEHFSFDVPQVGVSRKHAISPNLSKIGNKIFAGSDDRIRIFNTAGRQVTTGIGRVELSKIPHGVYFARTENSVLDFSIFAGNQNENYRDSEELSAAARKTDAIELIGMAYIVVNGDTVKSIPTSSWTLPQLYIIGRNHALTVPKAFTSLSVETVFWGGDKIAYTVQAQKNIDSTSRLTTVYLVQDSSDFRATSGLGSISFFDRASIGDTIVMFTGVSTSADKIVQKTDSSSWKFVSKDVKLIHTFRGVDSVTNAALTESAIISAPDRWFDLSEARTQSRLLKAETLTTQRTTAYIGGTTSQNGCSTGYDNVGCATIKSTLVISIFDAGVLVDSCKDSSFQILKGSTWVPYAEKYLFAPGNWKINGIIDTIYTVKLSTSSASDSILMAYEIDPIVTKYAKPSSRIFISIHPISIAASVASTTYFNAKKWKIHRRCIVLKRK